MPPPNVSVPMTAPMSGPTDASMHTERARSFDSAASAYELGRPAYPEAAIGWWNDHGAFGTATSVLDLAAGTGKLTRRLPTRCELHAVEPLPNMRADFVRVLPEVPILDGSAEAIPYPDDTFDTVVVAQAFHWFDHDAALAEIARVLRPGGGLGLIWNDDDVDSPESQWVARLVVVKRDVGGSSPIETARRSPAVLDASPHFGGVESTEICWSEPTTVDRTVADVASRSYVIGLAPRRRSELLAQVRQIVEPLGDPFDHPYRTFVTWATRCRG